MSFDTEYFLVVMEEVCQHPWVTNRAHPTVLLCDDDRDPISSLNPSETLAAIAEIREALKRSSES